MPRLVTLLVRALAALALLLPVGLPAWAVAAPSDAFASALREKYVALRERLQHSPYGRPLVLDSREHSNDLTGEAYAVIAHPFARVDAGLAAIGKWCEVLMLPFNTKHCEASGEVGASALTLFVGRKNETPVESAYRLDFSFAVAARTRDYLQLVLTSESGPLGTRDYRIVLEATPLADGRTFMKLGYSYGYGTLSRVAMQAYLGTIGARKVGFTTERGQLVRGMRGVMERNTMRYALAIEAYLDSLAAPPGVRVRKRLDDWFTATERYPRQLQEMEREEYLAMKQREFARMHARS